MHLLIELVQLAVVTALVVPALHFAFGAYARHRQPGWSGSLERRRLAILVILVCLVAGIQLAEDVLDGDSRPVDEAILWFLRDHAPTALVGFLEAVTVTGSSKVLAPLAVAGCVALLVARKKFEALLLAGSTVLGALLIWSIKAVVQRERPQLWETATYWGTSFPSGHTLAVAAFATAAAVCVARIRPRWQKAAMIAGAAWVALVGLSRLVLGVHWPTDVLVAACIGAAIPLTVSVAHELREAKMSKR
jgi:undecaprenyl-diphosphatase